jgi:broad specificity phosphatase PhoE
MVNIFLIRHGKASSGWNSLDPGLDSEGERQSREVSKKLLNYSSKDFDIFSIFCPTAVCSSSSIYNV